MTWTSHGHHISGTVMDLNDPNRPRLMRCGGPGLCKVCLRETVQQKFVDLKKENKVSADNGYIIRQNEDGNWALQMYFMSNDSYPPITTKDGHGGKLFDTLEEAEAYYMLEEPYSEYGLIVDTTLNKKEEPKMKIKQFQRKPFEVEGVQVTEENMQEVAEWCGGTVSAADSAPAGLTGRYIKVDVKHPLNKKQTQAYPTDWVLKTKNGFKVYDNDALGRVFEPVTENVFETGGWRVAPALLEARDEVSRHHQISGKRSQADIRHSQYIPFDITKLPER